MEMGREDKVLAFRLTSLHTERRTTTRTEDKLLRLVQESALFQPEMPSNTMVWKE